MKEVDSDHSLLPGRDTEDAATPCPRCHRQRSRWQLFRSWFGSFALGALCALVLTSIWSSIPAKKVPAYTYAKTDALPSVEWDTVMFKADHLYSERPTDDGDAAWNALLPNGRGFVFVDDAKARGLLPGVQSEYGDIHSVSMFHQLHCLARLRKSHYLLLDGVASGDLTFARQFVDRTAESHIGHCLDYLRQGIFCAGDMTLEWPKQEGSGSGARVDGWDIPHKCKNQDAIQDFMARYHFNGSLSIEAAG